jgi:hypothetical protein
MSLFGKRKPTIPRIVSKLHYLKGVMPEQAQRITHHIQSIHNTAIALGLTRDFERLEKTATYADAARFILLLTREPWRGETRGTDDDKT